MFVGHYAAAIAAKSAEPKIPLWSLVAASQLIDIAWAVFIMLGIEKARIDHTLPGSTFVLERMPWTHSLPAALAWSIAATVIAKPILKLNWKPAILIGAVVFSHWLLDLLVHRPDLALWPTGPKVGLALWNFEVTEQAVEIGLIALAALFWGAMRATHKKPTWPAATFILFLLAVQITQHFVPLEEAPLLMGASALATYLIITAIAALLDRQTTQKSTSPNI